MIKKFLEKRKEKKKRAEELKRAQLFYYHLQVGGKFMQFIYKDLEKMKKDQFNRSQRRRFEKQLEKKGKFSEDMVMHYADKIDKIMDNIEQTMKKEKVKSIDGAEYYAKLKALEKKGKLK